MAEATAAAEVAALTDWLETSGYRVSITPTSTSDREDAGSACSPGRTLIRRPRGATRATDGSRAASDVRLVSAGFATGLAAAVSREPDADARHSGI